MVMEVVDRFFNGLTCFKCLQMLDKQVKVQRVGMIEVRLFTLVKRQMSEIFVVRILADEDGLTGKRFKTNLSKRRPASSFSTSK